MQVEMEALKKHLFDENKIRNIKFYPGHTTDVSPEDMAREINKFFADADEATESITD